MMQELSIDKLIVLVPTIITAIVGYISWSRKNRYQRFINDLKENLEQVISPIYHSLRYISRIRIPELREKEILTFFQKYSQQNTNIFKISSMYILNHFYEIEELSYKFQNSRNKEDWKLFNYKFEEFYKMIEREYFESCSIQFIEHRWVRNLNSSNIWIRLYKESIKFLYDLFKFLIIFMLLLVYFAMALRTSKNIDLSFITEYRKIILYVSAIVVMIFAILIGLNSEYLSIYSMNKRDGAIKGLLKEIIKKKAPKIYSFEKRNLENKLKKYKNCPVMYEKKDIEVIELKKSNENVS